MNEPAKPTSCPVCAGTELELALEREAVPVNCNQLWPTRAEALAVPTGSMRLQACTACGWIWNSAFDPERVVYTPEYDASLHFSPRFQRYADELVARLAGELDLAGKQLLEVGCGKGEFLDQMCRETGCRGLGYDTSFSGAVPAGAPWAIRRETFGGDERGLDADLVASRHVLEHVPTPRDFLAAMRRAAAARASGRVFLEVPNGLWMLRDLGIWDVIYEHVSILTPLALRSLLAAVGLRPLWLEEAFGGQYLRALAEPAAATPAEAPPTELDAQLELVRAFAGAFRSKVEHWSDRLREFAERGEVIALWGAGAKGATFLSCVRPLDALAQVIDINPRKVGRFVPGTGYEVAAPESLRGQRLDAVLVMNPAYLGEIEEQLRRLGLEPLLLAV